MFYISCPELWDVQKSLCSSFQIPFDILPGSHRLLVEGLANTAGGDILFTNETELNFETKYMSVFIRTDHFEYYPENTGN